MKKINCSLKSNCIKILLFFTITLSMFILSCSNPNSKKEIESQKTNKLPQIKITSETKSNRFVTETMSDVADTMNNHPSPYYEKCTLTVIDDNDKIVLDEAEGQVKVRGNWTTSYDKKGLRIKFDKKQSMLGLNGGNKMKSWVLLASYKDWSFLRDSCAFYMSKIISKYYASDFQLVEVYINDKYWGVYLLAEQQQINENRINITEAKDNYQGTDIGYLMELDSYYTNEDYKFEIDYNHSIKDYYNKSISNFNKGYTIKSDIYSDAQVDFIKSFMNNVWTICYEAVYKNNYLEFNDDYTELVESAATSSYECVTKVIDIDSLVDTYIIQEVACDPDLYWSSFYMDVDFGPSGNKKLTFEAPWDFDSTMGNKNHCANGQGVFAGAINRDVNYSPWSSVANPWMLIFINTDWFQSLIKQKWSYVQEQKVLEKLTAYIDSISDKYVNAFEKNYERWNNIGNNWSVGNELCNAAAACKTEKEAADYLKNWLKKRFAAIDDIWKE